MSQRALDTRRVAAGDHDRALVTERFRNHLNPTFAGGERWQDDLVPVRELPHQRVVLANENERGLLFWLGDGLRATRRRNVDTRRLEPEATRQIDGAAHTVARRNQQRVDAVRNPIVVGVAEKPVRREKAGQVEGGFGARARPSSQRPRCRQYPTLGNIDVTPTSARGGEPNAKLAYPWIAERLRLRLQSRACTADI